MRRAPLVFALGALMLGRAAALESLESSLTFTATFAALYWLVTAVSALQLLLCVRKSGITTTCQKMLHSFVLMACLSRGIYYAFQQLIPEPFKSLVFYFFYVCLMSCYAMIITYWAGFYNQTDRTHVASTKALLGLANKKSRIAFVVVISVLYTAEAAKWMLSALLDSTITTLITIAHNGFLLLLFLAAVVVFWIYGIELYFKIDRCRNVHRGNRVLSRVGLCVQLTFQILFLASFMAATVAAAQRKVGGAQAQLPQYELILARTVEFALMLWWPCVLWLPGQDKLWVLNPNALILDDQQPQTTPCGASKGPHCPSPAFSTAVPASAPLPTVGGRWSQPVPAGVSSHASTDARLTSPLLLPAQSPQACLPVTAASGATTRYGTSLCGGSGDRSRRPASRRSSSDSSDHNDGSSSSSAHSGSVCGSVDVSGRRSRRAVRASGLLPALADAVSCLAHESGIVEAYHGAPSPRHCSGSDSDSCTSDHSAAARLQSSSVTGFLREQAEVAAMESERYQPYRPPNLYETKRSEGLSGQRGGCWESGSGAPKHHSTTAPTWDGGCSDSCSMGNDSRGCSSNDGSDGGTGGGETLADELDAFYASLDAGPCASNKQPAAPRGSGTSHCLPDVYNSGEDELTASDDATAAAALCWICYDDSIDQPFIRPCLCKGSMRHVHEHCLRRWVSVQGEQQYGTVTPHCNVCKEEYSRQPLVPWRAFLSTMRLGWATVLLFLATFAGCFMANHFIAQRYATTIGLKGMFAALLLFNEFFVIVFFAPRFCKLIARAQADCLTFVSKPLC